MDGLSEVWTHPDSQAGVFLLAGHAFALLFGSDAAARPAAFLSRRPLVVLLSDLAAHDFAAFDLAADLPSAVRVGFAPARDHWC